MRRWRVRRYSIAGRQLFLSGLCIFVFFLGVWGTIRQSEKVKPAFVQYHGKPKIIIDAGHGGFDGGAVGIGNVVEKDINLAISQKLRDLLTVNGFEVVMTRNKDEAIHDPTEVGLARQKRSDMYHRRDIMEENPDGLFLSVHQNKFQQAGPKGAQIFYSINHEDSEQLAQILQNSFRIYLQPDNQRQIKKAGEELFLLDKAKIPAVLVECGFLSNPEDCSNLLDEEYQNKVAFTLYLALMEFYNT